MGRKPPRLYIFYKDPDPDRWFKYDRYPRQILRKVSRKISGKAPVASGVKKWFTNLTKGLDTLGYPYSVNDFRSLRDPNILALVVGRPQLIEDIPDHTKIMYGPAVASHPSDNDFWGRKQIVHLLFSCEWLRDLYQRDLSISIPSSIWPSGIETDVWKPPLNKTKKNRVMVYDKIRWDRDLLTNILIDPILNKLEVNGMEISYFRYGKYEEEEFRQTLARVDFMIFLCEHETQGFAYLQALSADVPIFAWDRGGSWKDPNYYPQHVIFEPVTSVPYWDERCGYKFRDVKDFEEKFGMFVSSCDQGDFLPRAFILENLTLEICAKKYIEIYKQLLHPD